MGLMDKIKGAAGVGTASMQVDVKQRPSKRGEQLVAVIRVTGGKQNQKMNYLVVDFRWIGKWQIQSSGGGTIDVEGTAIFYRFNQPGSEGVMVEAGKTLEFPVTISVPPDAPTSNANLKFDFGVRADIEGASDPTYNTQLDITA